MLHVTFSDATISASNRALRATVRRLSWGFPKIAPPSCAAEESTPVRCLPCKRAPLPKTATETSGPAEPPPIHVPSPRFFAALTVYASSTLPVYCNELPTMGFTMF